MRVVVWPVHGGWMDGFLRGAHTYLVPAAPGVQLPDAAAGARRVDPAALREEAVDVVVLQRTEELALASRLLGRVPGRDIAAVFVEHNTPKRHPISERHVLADQREIPIVHVTHFNHLVWDCGKAPTRVIEHGVPDPGARYSGELPALGVVVNEPVRRGRVTGTDLLPTFAATAPLDCFGIDTDLLPGALQLPPDRLRVGGDLPTAQLHHELSRRRAYLHPYRWTSLGLSLLEAMHLGMPVLALAATEVPRAVPPEAGAVSADPAELAAAARQLLANPEEARARGRVARDIARERYGIARFHADWGALLAEVVETHATRVRARVGRTHQGGRAPLTSGTANPARADVMEGAPR